MEKQIREHKVGVHKNLFYKLKRAWNAAEPLGKFWLSSFIAMGVGFIGFLLWGIIKDAMGPDIKSSTLTVLFIGDIAVTVYGFMASWIIPFVNEGIDCMFDF